MGHCAGRRISGGSGRSRKAADRITAVYGNGQDAHNIDHFHCPYSNFRLDCKSDRKQDNTMDAMMHEEKEEKI